MKNELKELQVIEIPYDETEPFWKVYYEEDGKKEVQIESYVTRPAGWRELDDYKLCGVYHKAGVPFEVSKIECNDKEKPHEEQIKNISSLTKKSIGEGKALLMVGGGCSHAIGVAGGLRKALGQETKIGLIWLDAHGDINTPETTESGLLGGTPLAVCAGLCSGKAYQEWMDAAGLNPPIEERDIILTDARDLDPKEEKVLNAAEVIHIDTETFNDPEKWKTAVDQLATRVDVLYLHIDGDILDGKYTPDHFTIEFGGPDIETVMNNIKTVMATNKVLAFSLVSIYFDNDKPGKEVSTLNGMRLLGSGLEAWKWMPEVDK